MTAPTTTGLIAALILTALAILTARRAAHLHAAELDARASNTITLTFATGMSAVLLLVILGQTTLT
jgi:hypothetical protein